jgi:hypothetical protein
MYMDYKNILNAINRCDNIYDIKTIINSINDNQVASKEWLLENCHEYFDMFQDAKIIIMAGWYGLLGDMLYNGKYATDITICDMDPKCKLYGKKLYPHLKYRTDRMSDVDASTYDEIICTACEHITDTELNEFLLKKKSGALVILQSNNYYGIDGHINCKNSLDEFKSSVNLTIIKTVELKLEKYTRFMIIGY